MDYWREFERPKIIWADLAYHSEFAYDPRGEYFTNDLCFVLPTEDLWVLAILNSPLMWSFLWRTTVHGKDETLRLKKLYMAQLPIAPPAEGARERVEPAVQELFELAGKRQQALTGLLEWLRVEFQVETPGRKLSAPDRIPFDVFVSEVKRRRGGGNEVGSRELSRLRSEYNDAVPQLAQWATRSHDLELAVAAEVHRAYGLTEADVRLLWSTAPPRMPLNEVDEEAEEEGPPTA